MSQSSEAMFSDGDGWNHNSDDGGDDDGEPAKETSAVRPRVAPRSNGVTPKRADGHYIKPANFFSRSKGKRPRSPYVPETSSEEEDEDEIPLSQLPPLRKKSAASTSRSPEKESLQDTLRDVKTMLHVLFEKVEKNENSLRELRDHHSR